MAGSIECRTWGREVIMRPRHRTHVSSASRPRLITDIAKLRPIEVAVSTMAPETVLEMAGESLSALSSATEVEHVEVSSPAITDLGNDKFEASATVFVTLHYGDKYDPVAMSDGFPARIRGHFSPDKKAHIDTIEVDSRAFYE
jgi:hypothetical protein